MNEHFLEERYVAYCEELAALRKSGDWKAWHDDWDHYCKVRWGLSKSRAKLICAFAKFRDLAKNQLFHTLPETPEQVKAILALPQKDWLETWELVCNYCELPITPQNVEACLEHFKIFGKKKIPPDILKGIRLRRAAKTVAQFEDGEKLASELGPRGLGKNWDQAVRVVIDADNEKRNIQAARVYAK
jgi:hypothetical protein